MTTASAFKVHNVDQRQREVCFESKHKDGSEIKVELEQHGANSTNFVSGTSSVVWPCADRMGVYLCMHPELVTGKTVVELGSGTGLVGLVASKLGPIKCVLTDAATGILAQNAKGFDVEVASLFWGDAHELGTFDVVLMSDLVCNQGRECMELLIQAMLSVGHRDTKYLMTYEHRDDWFTMTSFFEICESHGLIVESNILGDDEDDDDFILYTIYKSPKKAEM